MRKINILSAVILLSLFCLPVSVAAQNFSPGIEAGATISSSTWKFANGQNTKSVGGYTIGLTFEFEILDKTWIKSGLSFLTKGAQVSVTNETVEGSYGVVRDRTETFRPMYVHIPINLAYKIDITRRTRLFATGGIFLSQGIGGEYNKKITYSGSGSSGWQPENINQNIFSSKALKRFDCGANLGAGIEFGKTVLRVGYDWSLLDIAKDKTVLGTDQFKNRSLAIAVGLKFR